MLVFETVPKGGIDCPGGQTVCFPVQLASGRCTLTKIICAQTAGTPANFTLELFNRETPCVEGSASATDTDDETLSDELFRVAPPLSGVSGLLRHFSEDASGGHGYTFVSQDEQDATGRFKQNLWCRLTVQGSSAKTFSIVIGGKVALGD
jgi:hypothetical protein